MWQLKYRCQSTAAATAASPGGFGGLFGCSWQWKIQLGRKKIFRKKNGYMGVHGCAPICPFFYEKMFDIFLRFFTKKQCENVRLYKKNNGGRGDCFPFPCFRALFRHRPLTHPSFLPRGIFLRKTVLRKTGASGGWEDASSFSFPRFASPPRPPALF